jgi:hypothetical protein
MADLPPAIITRLDRLTDEQKLNQAVLDRILFKISVDYNVSMTRLKRQLFEPSETDSQPQPTVTLPIPKGHF